MYVAVVQRQAECRRGFPVLNPFALQVPSRKTCAVEANIAFEFGMGIGPIQREIADFQLSHAPAPVLRRIGNAGRTRGEAIE